MVVHRARGGGPVLGGGAERRQHPGHRLRVPGGVGDRAQVGGAGHRRVAAGPVRPRWGGVAGAVHGQEELVGVGGDRADVVVGDGHQHRADADQTAPGVAGLTAPGGAGRSGVAGRGGVVRTPRPGQRDDPDDP
ncbi:hypothetical protein SDC9_86033 [bioreactor metagenome]|uniref:Uncharacterized protein n=1 Tax=bioreactor metagenome TaxID=1076179 RepID=A0A644ZEV0_9ZZZZ